MIWEQNWAHLDRFVHNFFHNSILASYIQDLLYVNIIFPDLDFFFNFSLRRKEDVNSNHKRYVWTSHPKTFQKLFCWTAKSVGD